MEKTPQSFEAAIQRFKEMATQDLLATLTELAALFAHQEKLRDKVLVQKGHLQRLEAEKASPASSMAANLYLELLQEAQAQIFKTLDKLRPEDWPEGQQPVSYHQRFLEASKELQSLGKERTKILKEKERLQSQLETKKREADDWKRKYLGIKKNARTLTEGALKRLDKFYQAELLRSIRDKDWRPYKSSLQQLIGYWVEYIPSREASQREFSIARFWINPEGKHEFRGTNYNYTMEVNSYTWETIKVLPPVELDERTFYLYFLYRRNLRGKVHKYGFGRLTGQKNPDSQQYEFVDGFFFNEQPDEQPEFFLAGSTTGTSEATHPGFTMKLQRLEQVAAHLGLEMTGKEEKQAEVLAFLQKLRANGLYRNW